MNFKAGNLPIDLPTGGVLGRIASFTAFGGAAWVAALGRMPVIRGILRSLARFYREGSVVTIKRGSLAGMKWKRSHRYVNGYWLGIYELEIQRCLLRHLRNGRVFYDVGANAGFFSLLGAKCVGDAGKVYSFEPLPENASALRANCEVNNLANCFVVEAAVSDRTGESILIHQESLSDARLSENETGPEGAITVATTSLDEFAKTHDTPSFIKVDVEGGEASVLEGCLGLMRSSNPPTFLIELHNEEAEREVCRLLEAHRYSVELVGPKDASSNERPHHILALPEGTAR